MGKQSQSDTLTTGGKTIRLPKPHSGQRAILQSNARFKIVSAGRRWRKTSMGLHPAVEDSLKGKTVLWGAPTIEQSRIGWGELRKACGGVYEFQESKREAISPTGGRVIFKTLDEPDNARGFTLDGVIIDEASIVKSAAWYEVIRPALSDTNGWALFMFTPKGHNWVWQEAMKAHDNADTQAWQVPTLGVEIVNETLQRKPHPLENPDFQFAEAVKLFDSQPRRIFEQEFLAQYIDESGGVFRNIRECCTAQPDIPANHVGHHIVMGGDWGQANDFTTLGAYCVTCNREVEIDRFNQVAWAIQRGRVRAMWERWQAEQILLESNSIGGPNIEALQNDGLPVTGFETTAQSKPQLIQSLALALEKKERTFIDDPVTIGELEAYEEKRSIITGRPQYSAPDGLHDDTVIRAALENWAAGGGGRWWSV